MEAEVRPRRPDGGMLDRLAAAFLITLMAIGSLALWIAVPAAGLWATSQITDTTADHYLLALPATLAGMAAWGAALFWLNSLYLRVTGFWEEPEDPDQPPRRLRGPLEPLLVGSLVIALVALTVWFFTFQGDPGPASPL